MIPFNKPYFTGKEIVYMEESLKSGKISSGGAFTLKCQEFFEKKYHFRKALLTTSCTDALEMAAILLDIKPGDEVIAPSYTFVSTVNPFVLRGAKIVFADSKSTHPCINDDLIEELITPKTKAIIVVHYAGVACNMDKVMTIASRHNLFVIEDAAHSIDSFYTNKPIGSIGHFAAFSFHETKNITCGEGGMLIVNDEQFIKRAEVMAEKGTNRKAFLNGKIDKYEWIDVGSSFMPSDTLAAFLFAQLERLADIQTKRKSLWQRYYNALKPLESGGYVQLPFIPEYSSNSAHLFYIVCKDLDARNQLQHYLMTNNISSVFHYLSLHKSPYYKNKHDGRELIYSDKYSDCLLRLPLYYELQEEQIDLICETILKKYKGQ
jgi:dTDP-4-amino-4,6-dideoxygalactose transaminase